jgi:hypothetical protein
MGINRACVTVNTELWGTREEYVEEKNLKQ